MYRINIYIPAEVEESLLFVSEEEALRKQEEMRGVDPSNIYEIEEVDET